LFLSEDLVIDGLKKVAEETAAKANEQVNNNKHHYTYPLKGYFFLLEYYTVQFFSLICS
jgi:hypothetical protein